MTHTTSLDLIAQNRIEQLINNLPPTVIDMLDQKHGIRRAGLLYLYLESERLRMMEVDIGRQLHSILVFYLIELGDFTVIIK